jgi:nitrogenase molybdenum-iron protein alpha/beta subunit
VDYQLQSPPHRPSPSAFPSILHGFPMLDHLGNNHRCTVGYRGTLDMLFDIGNIFLEADQERVHELVHQWREE